ncbi:hypothetical protein [Mongoliitalea daihaiensis]|uniref:hypothetical protein n=1 Tax=Mongoliitalea daihaiensis TaxID=2782006 RepID=UPI001F3E483F|nr:hypothetical protein [Mongoliitalea daihaiensis]UJP63742.1 hypothetical protein IPZ59_12990 [Mongoliitalea daihaiensis]
MKKIVGLLISLLFFHELHAQSNLSNRSTFYGTIGTTSANLREFNNLLEDKGLSSLRKGYSNYTIGYMARFNDFILGLEVIQSTSPRADFDDYQIGYRTSRAMLNVGFSFTEEGRFQLIHYMAIGTGSLNFQMINPEEPSTFNQFMTDPRQGFILRDGDIHRGSLNLTGFLTEFGFHLAYDFPIPGRNEALELIAKFGYSFSPFEDSWKLNGMSFSSTQSGAFLRVGAGISIPDHNYFYKDADIGVHFLGSMNFTSPTNLNEKLAENGLNTFGGRPNNWGLKVLGYNKDWLYGVDLYNLGMSGQANEQYNHTLNSVRLYANLGKKFFEFKNIEMGVLGGLGYGNLRYTLINPSKPDFPTLFENPNFDGRLTGRGLMVKPEVYLGYGLPLALGKFFKLFAAVHAGYEQPIGAYRLGDLGMSSYMSNPYVQFSIGIRP